MNIIMVMSDSNTEVGADNRDREHIKGRHGVGQMNDNSERQCEVSINVMAITGTIFPC